jgi:hypothetical protein
MNIKFNDLEMAMDLDVEYHIEDHEVKITSVKFGNVEILDALGDQHIDQIEQKILE